jgi:hypothetical protein
MSTLPTLKRVKAKRGYALDFVAGGKSRTADLAGLIARNPGLKPLTAPGMFAKAKVVDWGAAVGWPGDIAISVDTLIRLAEEQSPFTTADFVHWQKRLGLSNQETADALGVSLATVKNIRAGGSISDAVAIACRAMASDPVTLAAHFVPRAAGRPKGARVPAE